MCCNDSNEPIEWPNLKAIFLPQEKIVDGHLFLGALSWVTTCTNNKPKFYINIAKGTTDPGVDCFTQ